MKSTIKKLFVILAIVMSFVAVQSVCAETVTGTIDAISTMPNKIEVDGTEISGVKINYLINQYDIVLETGLVVSVDVYDFICSDGTTKYMATSITVGDITVKLR